MGTGGYRHGAGRPGRRQKCERFLALDIRKLNFQIVSRFQFQEPDAIAVSIFGGDAHVVCGASDFHVNIVHTRCNFGGVRPWWLCPLCSRRCAILYGQTYDGRFKCRSCMDLAYTSEAENTEQRLKRKQRKLEMKLGDHGDKLPWMRWLTHERISLEVGAVKEAAFYVRVASIYGRGRQSAKRYLGMFRSVRGLPLQMQRPLG